MIVKKLNILGLLLIEPRVFTDARGNFWETFQAQHYRDAGINEDFVQDNFSQSLCGTIRGMHLQSPNEQGKLVFVTHGAVYDVAVDLRSESPSYGQWFGISLSCENRLQLYIPPGFAHGFCVTSRTAGLHYKCTNFYRPDCEHSIRWDDPDLAIRWPVKQPILSGKDANAISFSEWQQQSANTYSN
jgi:dTDP-4-dehydrorhamnose 3,5-epimerase